MYSQISRIPNLIQKFGAKRCGLDAGVYGTSRKSKIILLILTLSCFLYIPLLVV